MVVRNPLTVLLLQLMYVGPVPEIIIHPENVTVVPNDNFTMNCLAMSFGLLKYDWSKRN